MSQNFKIVNLSIVDSDYYFKQILINDLTSNPFFKIQKNCNNGHELLKQLYRGHEDIFLIDLFTPLISGLEAIKHLRQIGNNTPIIAYSPTYQEDISSILHDLPNLFYCQKKSIIILDILRNYVLSETQDYNAYRQKWPTQTIDVEEYMQRQKTSWYNPTPTEIQLMKLCYEGLSNKEIGQYQNLSPRTVDTYITRLTKKLGLRNKIDLIRFCVEQGYYNSSS